MDAEELQAIEELKAMSQEELDKVPFEVKKWVCQCKGCTNSTRVRDYGIFPFIYSPRKKWGWHNLMVWYFLCGRHSKIFKRLERSFDYRHIERRLLDPAKIPANKLIDIK